MESDGSSLLADTSTCAELTRQAVDHIKPLVRNQIKALEKKVERAQLKASLLIHLCCRFPLAQIPHEC